MKELSPETVQNAYNKIYKEYSDAFFDEHHKKPKDREVLDHFARLLAKKSPVLDCGCGPGHTVKYLASKGVCATGIDISNKMIEQAGLNYPGLKFCTGNILNLSCSSNSVAGVLCFYSIVHFTQNQVKQALQEFYRILKPGGVLLLAWHVGDQSIFIEEFLGKKVNLDFNFFTTEFVESALRGAGFHDIKIITREPYPDIEYPSVRAYTFALKNNNR